jgi:hypothetical protein
MGSWSPTTLPSPLYRRESFKIEVVVYTTRAMHAIGPRTSSAAVLGLSEPRTGNHAITSFLEPQKYDLNRTLPIFVSGSPARFRARASIAYFLESKTLEKCLILLARPKRGADDHRNAMYFQKNLACLPRI